MQGWLPVETFLTDQQVARSPRAPARPLISVVLPTYARGRDGLLERAIRSVLSQEFEDLELIVVDDGSKDGSERLIKAAADCDPRLVHVRHERNSGLPALRVNEGIELARGEYLAFQFDDDAWQPRALASLLEAAKRQKEPSVIVGRSRLTAPNGEWTLPLVDLTLVTLYEQNRLANNSVLFPRQLVERHGMFDCHIGMRRLCDWDLWLRLLRHIPFVVIDEVISEVVEGNPGAIGKTVPWDLSLFRFLHGISRNERLTPSRWRDYVVDSLQVNGVELDRGIRRRLYEHQIVPYYLKHRHDFPQLEGFSPTLPGPPRSVVFTKGAYDVSNDISFSHFDHLSRQRDRYRLWFEPVSQVLPQWVRDADNIVLVRPVERQALEVLAQAEDAAIPSAVYLDDDILNFHELGPQFAHLAPGTPHYENITSATKRVDAVWVTNPFIGQSTRPLNPRLVPFRGAVPRESLPDQVQVRDPSRPLRIGYVGSGYRVEEFQEIWEGLVRFSEAQGDRVTFEFWGIDVQSFPPLNSPVVQRPFTFSYPYYLRMLRERGFDVLLSPLLAHPRARLGKCLIKYFETAVAGAMGIFSDVAPYRELPAPVTCLKTRNDATSWFNTLMEAAAMDPRQFDLVRGRALEHVREEFTEVAQIHKFEAALRATEFHQRTGGIRHDDGRPRVAYVLHSAHLAGAELQLWRRLRTIREYGVEPIVVIPRVLEATAAAAEVRKDLLQEAIDVEFVDYTCLDRPPSPNAWPVSGVRQFLERCRPALVHTVTFNPAFGRACMEMGLPHVASLYAVDDSYTEAPLVNALLAAHADVVHSDSIRYASLWGRLLAAEHFCSRAPVPEEVFEHGRRRRWDSLEQRLAARAATRFLVAGTLQERKGQREAIKAVRILRSEGFDCQLNIQGYEHFFPEYLEECRREIADGGLEAVVRLRGFAADVTAALGSADILLNASTFESFPNSISEAMAAGVLVVSTPVGGTPELIVDGVTGILCADTSLRAITDGMRRALRLDVEERDEMVERARRVARSEFHPQRTASDLLTMYLRALDVASARQQQAAAPSIVVSAPGDRGSTRTLYTPGTPESHVLLRSPLRYWIAPPADSWLGIDILIGTHRTQPVGVLELRVLTADHHPIRRASADLASARDNEWLDFRFDTITNARDERFELEFQLHSPAGTRVSVYEANPFEARWRRLARRLGLRVRGNTLYYRSWHRG
jgi:glycosyltransferase involved in cell wall biosynthesis